ncbi:Probable transmembrane protein of unknown function [Flavobacterium indicum GPTSA100-9 = DSM 17447]|uniref:DUF898 domain-containing protein n=1 Tax=Flavobacterium indicum (strain DSM 17447 / CIP 109464 / GPTSA100-9) TaxID=1094466 RepID=H8XND1_FLAIG|nr:YjgN family protein [Flavobacterium indicum]CCG52048.1 Probable transmembrane protein of unknown function [Flavobacterium indicum GPTSA100-9 = DSM 17447]
MEQNTTTNKNYSLDFQGKGETYFGIIIINWLLTIITLGFYYPWAKEKKLKYLYGETTLNNSPFEFHGTGKEMFIGFIKALGIFVLLYGVLFLFLSLNMLVVGLLLFYVGFLVILPIAIHGSYKYRMSRTSWRGIRFGYRGDRNELIKKFIIDLLLTFITLGIYGSWFVINLRKYIIGNIRFGDIKMEYKGDGADYFVMNLKGYFLTIFTIGIYFFWWQKDIFEYYVNYTRLYKNDESIHFKSTAKGLDILVLSLVNFLILVFTLGIGYAWVEMRTIKFFISNIELKGDIDLDAIIQTETAYKDATGEDIGDALDMDFVF